MFHFNWIFSFYFLVFAIAIAVLVLVMREFRQRGRARAFLDALGPGESRPKTSLFGIMTDEGKIKSGVHEGTPYEAEYDEARGEDTPRSLTVRVRAPSSGQFTLTKEGAVERLSKVIGLSRELETGDPAFDEEFYVQTNVAPFASAFFRSPERRHAVLEICSLGFTEVRHDGKVLEATWSPFAPPEGLDPSVVMRAVSHLARLAKDIPPPAPGARAEGVPAWKIKRALAFVVPGVWLATSLLTFETWGSWGWRSYRPLDEIGVSHGFEVTVPLAALCIALGWALVRGRATSHRELYWIVAMSVFALPLSFALVSVLNGWLDGQPETVHTARVLATKPDNRVILQSWRRPGRTEQLIVATSVHARLKPQRSTLLVATKPGRFGYEWVVRYELARE